MHDYNLPTGRRISNFRSLPPLVASFVVGGELGGSTTELAKLGERQD